MSDETPDLRLDFYTENDAYRMDTIIGGNLSYIRVRGLDRASPGDLASAMLEELYRAVDLFRLKRVLKKGDEVKYRREAGGLSKVLTVDSVDRAAGIVVFEGGKKVALQHLVWARSFDR